jgi:hypothetical protein
MRHEDTSIPFFDDVSILSASDYVAFPFEFEVSRYEFRADK